jgi:hypothetical protein
MASNGPSHADLVKAVRKLIEGDGGLLVKYPGGPLGPKGIADFLGVHKGRPVAIEVKSGRDKLTDDQKKFLARWRLAGGIGMEARDVKTVAKTLGIPLLL